MRPERFSVAIAAFSLLLCSVSLWADTLVLPTAIPYQADKRLELVEQYRHMAADSVPAQQLRRVALSATAVAGEDAPSQAHTEYAITLLERALAAFPGDPELLAAKGSATTMLARYTDQNTGKAMLLAKRGIRSMDRAVKRAPENLGARLQRAINGLFMPRFLNRLPVAEKDFTYILAHTDESVGPDFKAMVIYYLLRTCKAAEGENCKARYHNELPPEGGEYWRQRIASLDF
ncbi:hypothetical protein QQM79_18660 [Marinobacteraceae bacterium S3BR75-40.1]